MRRWVRLIRESKGMVILAVPFLLLAGAGDWINKRLN